MPTTCNSPRRGRLQPAGRKGIDRARAGSALLIALAFVVLLTGLILAFFSRSILEGQVSVSSANQVKAESFAMGAVAATISDLKQEMEAGSAVPNYPVTTPSVNYKTFYYTVSKSGAMIPAVTGSSTGPAPGSTFSGNTLGVGVYANLIKISQNGQPFFPAAANYPSSGNTLAPPSNRAAAVSTGISGDTTGSIVTAASATGSALSVDGTSLNGRYITGSRWNKPLFITPGTKFPLPDWIYVYRSPYPGPPAALAGAVNPTVWGTSLRDVSTNMSTTTPVVGRYAYAVYDEGGLLDINVAGAPTGMPSALSAYKNAEAMADLAQLKTGTTSLLTTAQINTIIGWRNNASLAQSQINSTAVALPGSVSTGYAGTWSPTNYTNYLFNVATNPTGFLQPMGAFPSSTTSISQTDQFFTSRQQLIQFFNNVLGGGTNVQTALQYFTHFSRDLNQPSYAPDPSRPVIVAVGSGGNDLAGQAQSAAGQNTLNPTFLSVPAGSAFTRNDGSTSVSTEPLVKKRFALNRLAWLTYQGPSASRTISSPSSTTFVSGANTDYDIYMLENTYGIPQSFLAQGNSTNIYNYFGLSWVPDSRATGINGTGDSQSKWVYNHTAVSPAGGFLTALPAHPTRIFTLAQVASAGRDPDFFELLKAAMTAGALGKPATLGSAAAGSPALYQNGADVSLDAQVIQIGANIIDQFDADSVPTRILFDDGTWPQAQEYRGIEDLPYLYALRSGAIRVQDTNPTFNTMLAGQANYGTVTIIDDYGPPQVSHNLTSNANPGVGSPTKQTAITVANAGVGAYYQVPTIWNPHAQNPNATAASLGPRPTNFRIFAIGGTPNMTNPPGSSDSNAILLQGYSRYGNGINPNPQTPTADVPAGATNGAGYVYCPLSFTTGTALQQSLSLTSTGTELDFQIPCTTSSLRMDMFREPTLLNKPNVPTDSNLSFGASNLVRTGALNTLLSTQLTDGTVGTAVGLEDNYPSAAPGTPATDGNAAYINNNAAAVEKTSTLGYPAYLGIFLGAFPLAWNVTATPLAPDPSAGTPANYVVAAGWARFTSGGSAQMTYRIQYQDPATGNWCTYDEKFTNPCQSINSNSSSNYSYYNQMLGDGLDFVYTDPRSSRWGALSSDMDSYRTGVGCWSWPIIPRNLGSTFNTWGVAGFAGPTTSWSTATSQYAAAQNATWTVRPDEESGFEIGKNGNTIPPTSLGWYHTGNFGTFRPGILCQNNPVSTLYNSQNSMGFFASVTPYGSAGNTTLPNGNIFYADPDGVVRRAMSGYLQPSLANVGNYTGEYSPVVQRPMTSGTYTAPSGLPLAVANTFGSSTGVATPIASEVASRPIILNRPFRSVAELGQVYSGTPWRNLDFATPESGNVALLDVFCINDTNDPNGLVAGKVNLNTRQPLVLQAILAGAYQDEFNPGTNAIAATNTSTTASADNIANALVARTTDTIAADLTSGAGPLRNVSDLVGKYNPASGTGVAASGTSGTTTTPPYDGGQTYSGFSGAPTTASGTAPTATPKNLSSILYGDSTSPNYYAASNIQRYREATVRALANAGQTRVWNLMIDVIAQTGRFPATAGAMQNFNVEGEKRYWVHVAIDRYTGKVIDQQVEEVKE